MISPRYHKKNITNSTDVLHTVMPSGWGVPAMTTHPRWSQGPFIWAKGCSFGAWAIHLGNLPRVSECLLWERVDELRLPKVQWTWNYERRWEQKEQRVCWGGEKRFSSLLSCLLVVFLLFVSWPFQCLRRNAKYPSPLPPTPQSSSVQRPFWAWQCSSPAEENRVVLLQSLTSWLW